MKESEIDELKRAAKVFEADWKAHQCGHFAKYLHNTIKRMESRRLAQIKIAVQGRGDAVGTET